MRTGERHAHSGFAYLWLLFFVALTAAGLAALGQAWSQAAQRERERELEFRGREIARAIESYVRASAQLPVAAGQPPQVLANSYPRSLDELLRDERGFKPLHHLRRRYVDPFTGLPDWELIPAAQAPQRFVGVRSSSEAPLLRETLQGVRVAHDWQFIAREAGAISMPAGAASAP